MILVTVCPNCSGRLEYETSPEIAERIIAGKEPIQNILPNESADIRERFITGICESCWDSIFEEQHDD